MLTRRLSERLPVGRKLALGYAITGLFFLLALWQYHQTLSATTERYGQLVNAHELRQNHALQIQKHLQDAYRHEKERLPILNKEHLTVLAIERIHLAISESEVLLQKESDPVFRRPIESVRRLMDTYSSALQELSRTREVVGVDHESGLQGDFRIAIHQVEERASHYSGQAVRTALRQLGNYERMFGADPSLEALTKVKDGVLLVQSLLQKSGGQSLSEAPELKRYINRLALIQEHWPRAELAKDLDWLADQRGQMQGLVEQSVTVDVEKNILELRRREKDFLLRGGENYVEMVRQGVREILELVADAPLSQEEKITFGQTLAHYEASFLVLADHQRKIVELEGRMRTTASQIDTLLSDYQNALDSQQNRAAQEILKFTDEKTMIAMGITLLAVVSGFLFVIFFSMRLSHRVAELTALAQFFTEESGAKEAVAEGDVSLPPKQDVRFIREKRDEIRLLSDAMGRMNGNLRDMFTLLDTNANGLDCAAHDMVESAGKITQCAEQILLHTPAGEEADPTLNMWATELRILGHKIRKRGNGMSNKARQLNQILDRIRW